ncbi:MAG: carbon-nitrogen hydrolase family protein [Ignavibacteriae bacterium]|nr:carbon-nitrogen hydrolase family protein [Ignavibacteriota bacterium]
MRICAAQTLPVRGDMQQNINDHLSFIKKALEHRARLIVFPELSLTGYEPSLAGELATSPEDKRLDVFQNASDEGDITVCVGVPTGANDGVRISMVIFSPGLDRRLYSKQYLHSDELPYFTEGNEQLVFPLEDNHITPAICYESLLPEHSEKANELGSGIYLTSVVKNKNGVEKVFTHYPGIAKKYSMDVIMSNSVGPCEIFDSYGASSAWNKEGKLCGEMDNSNPGILIYDTDTSETEIEYL